MYRLLLDKILKMFHSKTMAKSKTKKTAKNRELGNFWEKYKYKIVPAGIGGVMAFIFSGSFQLGVMVFLAVLVGSWVGHELLKKK